MNDFTKEELEFIYRSLKQLKWHKTSDIMKKIQFMIDNYCEHNFIGHGEGKYKFPYCNKCCQLIPIQENVENDNQ